MKALITPVVNLNGATAKSLIEQRMQVVHALDAAIAAMRSGFPHGRDYQHLIRGADWSEHNTTVREAQNAWHERTAALLVIRNELMNDAVAIQEQENDRNRRAL